ncbi:hypothetical protein EV363DRAFT_1149851 [Boletus edulis]|uniref:Uncharacterized protein n=1 Tax=Boletus edulis BED1 TaxID=1328754 RepID=A0AAD4C691_BOLED|nr:hypothetical protein EV363DRAFT_1149851 [Boletus edulis]KAF8448999.1 hypothetical protein L210DRAFT_3523644 [Boletus edulis BED1]
MPFAPTASFTQSTQAQRDRIFDIADMLFTAVPPEEIRLSRGPRLFKQRGPSSRPLKPCS